MWLGWVDQAVGLIQSIHCSYWFSHCFRFQLRLLYRIIMYHGVLTIQALPFLVPVVFLVTLATANQQARLDQLLSCW